MGATTSGLVKGVVFEPIPRVIHQTWKNEAVPAELEAYRASWRRYHPTWRHRLWTDESNRQLIAERHAWFLPTYDGFRRDIQRVDAAKYFILYTYGGVYADLDCECLAPLDELLERGGAVLGKSRDGVIECAFLASPPGHALWPLVFRRMQTPPRIARWLGRLPAHIGVAGFDASSVLFHTGPSMMLRAVGDYLRQGEGATNDGITVLDHRLLSSRSWWLRREARSSPEGLVRHHYRNTWLLPDELRFVRHYTARNVVVVAALLFSLVTMLALTACPQA